MNNHFSRGFICLIKIAAVTIAATAAVVGCSKEPQAQSIQPEDQNGQIYTFEAVQADSDPTTAGQTKTVIENETAVYWSPKDSVNIFYGTKAGGKFIGTNTTTVAKTTFNGTFNTFDGSINIGAEDPGFWGVYPYRDDAVCYGSSVSVVVPATQVAMEGTFAPDLFPAVAKSSGLALAFYNVCGGIKFTVSQKGIYSVTLKGNNNENLAGTVTVRLDSNGKPIVNSVQTGKKEITVMAPDCKVFVPGTEYFIVSLPVNFTAGFSLKYSKLCTEGTFTTSNNITIQRSTFGKVLDKDQDLTFNPIEGYITFVDESARLACTEKFGSGGKLTYAQAAAVTSLNNLFSDYNGVEYFPELKYFINVTNLEGCFNGCADLKEVTIPENITTIGENAFKGCTTLAEITIPETVTTISANAFDSNMKTVFMEGKAPSIVSAAFDMSTDFYVQQQYYTQYCLKSGWKDHKEHIFVIPGGANCFIISNYGPALFDCTKKGNSEESVGDIASAEVLWESFGTSTTPNVGDVVSGVSYSNGKVNFTANADGNAVIAVKDASGTVLWSWHIWVCKDFDPAASAQVYNNSAGTMMDRNLGATSATTGDVRALGLLYQWGRKDPFLSGNGILSTTVASSTLSWPGTVPSSSSTGTIAYAVAHPTTFITSNSSNYDWYYTGSSSTDNTRWQTSDKTKGIYDPCPQGWRVPDGGDSGVWSKAFGSSSSYSSGPWDDTNKGMNFGSDNGKTTSMQLGSASTIWYPAAGYRRTDVGSLYYVGSSGGYWSCTPFDDYACYVYFNNDGSVDPSYSGRRAYGRSVRCLSESK